MMSAAKDLSSILGRNCGAKKNTNNRSITKSFIKTICLICLEYNVFEFLKDFINSKSEAIICFKDFTHKMLYC